MVGVPGRIVDAAKINQRQQMAEKIGFDAYGVTADESDPIGKALYILLDHIQSQDQQLEKINIAIQKLGGDDTKIDLPSLDGVVLEPDDLEKVTP